ncbi:MAG: NapC/NirT family cytochrome c [Coriobacteriia bacterium]|nr:NapC/NirT family cytochrome c [Coriobacteriia bacterium]
MEHDTPVTTDESTAAMPPGGRARSVLRSVPATVRIAVSVVVGILVLAIAFDLGTSSPGVCFACHEMELRAASWAESAHTVVTCVKCHQAPTEWYELPTRVAGRAALLARDVAAHVSGDFADPVDAPAADAEPVSDDVCLQCHDPNRTATSGYRILIDHVEHAKRNGSCVSCHVRTAHPSPTRGGPLSLMGQCYTCHGTPEYPDADTGCATCHPADYEPLPQTHMASAWARGHGDVSEDDAALCTMCHEQSYCDGCHGLAMPHPERWSAGAEGHAVVAERDPAVCTSCHSGGPDLCTMCHHTSYEPLTGAWIEQHSVEVIDEGADYCLTCHSAPYCSFCHTRLVESD